MSASPEYRTFSGETTSTFSASATTRLLLRVASSWFVSAFGQLLGFRLHLVDVADVEERLLGQVVEATVDNGFKGLDRFSDRHVLTVEGQ